MTTVPWTHCPLTQNDAPRRGLFRKNGAGRMAKVELKLASDHLRQPLASELENEESHCSNKEARGE